jgi:uncharacterized protein (DUF1778 family)
MPKTPVNYRLDPALVQAIGAAADHLGQTRTEFVRRALTQAVTQTWASEADQREARRAAVLEKVRAGTPSA